MEIKDSAGNPDTSQADKSAITTPGEDKSREERARVLIEEIVGDKLKPLEASILQIPSLIKQTVVDVFNQFQTQAAENPATPTVAETPGAAKEKLAAYGELAKVIAPFFGKGETPPPDPLLEMIKGAFSKMIQAKVDETIMGTYAVKVPPPPGMIEPTRPTSKLNIE